MTRDMKLTDEVLSKIAAERWHQEEKFPDQRLRLGGGPLVPTMLADVRRINDRHSEDGGATWTTVLMEELYEALLETDPDKQYAEMVQVAAVATRIAENIKAGLLL